MAAGYGQYKTVRRNKAVLPPAPLLTPAQQARAARMRDEWRAAFGDDQFIREMVGAGLIYGWRNVISVSRVEEGNDGTT